MASVVWVVQSNLGNEHDLERMRAAFRSLGVAHREVQAIPFSDELPDFACDGPCVFYGATGFVHKAWLSRRWRPCAFFDEDKFRFSYWRTAWADHLLNAGAETMTLGAFAGSGRAPDSLWFIRPDKDSKIFAGEVIAFADVKVWAERLSAGGFTFGTDEPIVVAEPQHVRREWRVFLVDGRVSTSSQYRENFRLAVQAGAPPEVIAFAEARAAECPIAPAFALDIALASGELKIIEANCINSAGFYHANVERLISDLSALVTPQ